VARDPFLAHEIFAIGNEKLGNHVYVFSLPAIVTCPGRSNLCEKMCYACRRNTRFSAPSVQDHYWRNWEMSQRHDFHEIAAQALLRCRHPLFRLHVSGDFYNEGYAWKWLQVVKTCPHVTFWAYTRSWTEPAILEVLNELADQPNFFMWFSADKEMQRPKRLHPRVRRAYMMVEHDDVPGDVDLYFRTHGLREQVVKRVGDTLVCPAENGVTHTKCNRCKICFTDPKEDQTRRTKRGDSSSLPVLVGAR
jgi:hypothetical protein